MSSYPDDNYDSHEEQPSNERAIRAAKGAVMIPAIGLILIGAIGLISMAYGLVQFPNIDKSFDESIKQIENDPKMPAAQKKETIDMLNQARDLTKAVGIPCNVVNGLISLLILVAGVKLMNLGSPLLVKFGAVLSFIPFLGGCCFLGLLFGIWALVVMSKPEVKAGFAARRRMNSPPPDAY